VRIVVLGSLNMDLVVRVPRLPLPGETLSGHSFFQAPGGKGANQAVAAARLGGEVEMVGRVGDDAFGAALLDSLARAGASTGNVQMTTDVSTGVALIFVDDAAENVIVVAPGANGILSPSDAEAVASAIRQSGALIMQLEIPLETVQRAAAIAHDAGVHVILNAAPARDLPAELLALVDTLAINRSELAILSGSDAEPPEAAIRLLERGPHSVLVTLGPEGSLLVEQHAATFVPAFKVEAVDTTAAGDAFTAAYAVALLEGWDPEARLRFAGAAAAIKVTRQGAQPGMPARHEVDEFLASCS
jgi:ribokinase